MIMQKKLIELPLPINMIKPIFSSYELILPLLFYGLEHFMK
jgi:hypothetical protein